MADGVPKIEIRDLTVRYGRQEVLSRVSLDIPRNQVFAIIGPSNSGKTTLLKCLNRTIDMIPGSSVRGTIRIDGQDVSGIGFFRALRKWLKRSASSRTSAAAAAVDERSLRDIAESADSSTRIRDLYDLRRRIGVVFPLPVGLPLSVYDNVAYAPRMAGVRRRVELDETVERCLRMAALWDEVKDRLKSLGTLLSGGQQQRLTIARALSHDPEILCLDEFSIAIDPVTTMRIEDMLLQMKGRLTIILITNLVQQARRLGDRVCFLNKGQVVQEGPADVMFSEHPGNQLTYDYIHGVFG
jgi:phosphate transport system ATP-binding protein